jgi:hypothetical protein
MVSEHFFDLGSVSLVNFTHILLELRELFFLLHLQVHVAFFVRLHFLLLVNFAFLQLRLVFVHHLSQTLLVLALHFFLLRL